MLLFLLEAVHCGLGEGAAGGRRAEGIAAGKGVLGAALGHVVVLGQEDFGALRLEAAVEEIGAELENVARLVL